MLKNYNKHKRNDFYRSQIAKKSASPGGLPGGDEGFLRAPSNKKTSCSRTAERIVSDVIFAMKLASCFLPAVCLKLKHEAQAQKDEEGREKRGG